MQRDHVTSLRLSQSEYDGLAELMKVYERPRAQLIRFAIREFIDKHNETNKTPKTPARHQQDTTV
jgi:predicted DNA-binding protein